MVSNMDMIRKNTRLSREQVEWLEKASAEKGISVSVLIMMAVENYMIQETQRREKMYVASIK